MKILFNKLLRYVGKSVREKRGGKVSSSRLSSYSVLFIIMTVALIFSLIEIVNAIMLWSSGMPYVIPSEHIVIFGMLLAHHLTLLGINKNAETKVEQAVQDKLKGIGKPEETDVEEAPYIDESGKENGDEEEFNEEGR